jgi:hypothetical protein
MPTVTRRSAIVRGEHSIVDLLMLDPDRDVWQIKVQVPYANEYEHVETIDGYTDAETRAVAICETVDRYAATVDAAQRRLQQDLEPGTVVEL